MNLLEQIAEDTDLFWKVFELHVGDIHGDIFASMVETHGTPDQQLRCRLLYQRRMEEINAEPDRDDWNIDKEERVSAVS